MTADKLAAAFTAAVRYSRRDRHDDELATWRRTLHEAAGREDDLPFAVFADWLEDHGLAEQPMLTRLRSEGAHAQPMHFAQHPETGEVVEWPRHSNFPLVTTPEELHEQRHVLTGRREMSNDSKRTHAIQGPGGIFSIVRNGEASHSIYQHTPSGTGIVHGMAHDSAESAVREATRAAFPQSS